MNPLTGMPGGGGAPPSGAAEAGVPQPPLIRSHGSVVTMTAQADTTIFYSLDGRDPTPASQEYSAGKNLELGIGQYVVKAIAVRGGIGSEVTSSFYNYTPRALVMQPDSGTYQGKVAVSVTGEHNEVRYTLDGLLPTEESLKYERPIIITDEGSVTVTAAMFSNGLLIGEPVRRKYIVSEMAPDPVVVLPPSGSYECPLRIVMEGEGSVRYTLDGDEPTMVSNLYSGPVVISSPCDLTVRAILYDPRGRVSAVTTTKYTVTRSTTGTVVKPESVIPHGNIEFTDEVEESARKQAEEVMSFVLAASEMKERKAAEVVALHRKLQEAKESYNDAIKSSEELTVELSVANDQRRQLQEQKAAHVCSAQADLEGKLLETRLELQTVQQQEKSVDTQYRDALGLHQRLVDERKNSMNSLVDEKSNLQQKYLRNKKTLHGFPTSTQNEVHSLQMVTAEQRHEIALLKDTLAALQNSEKLPLGSVETDPSHQQNPFAPARKMVELPTVETTLPIPPGSMRKITSVKGDGLQTLRKKHSVDACIVDLGGRLAVRVLGHSAGVNNCLEEIERMLE